MNVSLSRATDPPAQSPFVSLKSKTILSFSWMKKRHSKIFYCHMLLKYQIVLHKIMYPSTLNFMLLTEINWDKI